MKAVLHHVSFFARSSWKGFCHRAFLVLAFFFYTAPNDFYHCNKHGVCWTSCGLSFPPIFIEFKCLEHLNLMFCCNKEVNKISTNAVTSALASCLCLSGHLSWSSDLNVAWLWVGSSETCEYQDTGRYLCKHFCVPFMLLPAEWRRSCTAAARYRYGYEGWADELPPLLSVMWSDSGAVGPLFFAGSEIVGRKN